MTDHPANKDVGQAPKDSKLTLSRRTLIGTAIASAAPFVSPGLGSAMTKASNQNLRIDTHHHFMPKVFVDTIGADRLAASVPNRKMPDWSVTRALDVCDKIGIGRAILSLSPGYAAIDAATEKRLMHECNEEAAKIRADHPTRFGHFASILMTDPEGAMREIDYAYGKLNSDGIVVSSNFEGRYLGDPGFEEIWQELDKRKAVVFIHPAHPSYDFPELPPESVMEYPFDTTRAAVSLVMNGVTVRYPNIRFILSHAGGTLPYIAARVAGGLAMAPGLVERIGDPMAQFRKFYFDTALSGSEFHLAVLTKFADPTRILYGTDFPYAPDSLIKSMGDVQMQYPMNEKLRAGLMHDNAKALLTSAPAV